MKTILEDKRPITLIIWDKATPESYSVGRKGLTGTITKIVPYSECGVGSDITWLAVYREEEIEVRVPAWRVTIYYY